MTFAPAHDGSIIGAVYFGTLINNVECFEELEVRKPIADEIRDKVDENLNVENIDKFPSFRVASEEAMSTLIEICQGIIALTRAHLDGTPEVMDHR